MVFLGSPEYIIRFGGKTEALSSQAHNTLCHYLDSFSLPDLILNFKPGFAQLLVKVRPYAAAWASLL